MIAPAELAPASTRRASGPAPRPGIANIPPYKGGSGEAQGHAAPVKLSANENALGASPAARAAFRSAAEALHVYPEGSAKRLREAIGAAENLDPARIVCGAGSDELLQLLARGYAGPGDEVLFTTHAFVIYKLFTLQAGATPVAAPETNLCADVDALLAHVTPRTKILFLANPNNPTGTYLSRSDIARLHAGLPEHVLLVLDGAYSEYLRLADYDCGLSLATEAPNVVVTRTFSKIHGLSALRLGWAYGPEAIVDVLHRLRLPFNTSTPGLLAGIAAIGDRAFVAASADHNDRELPRLKDAARRLGLLATESVGNFILLRFPDLPGKTAPEVDAALQARGLILRPMGAYSLPDCLRLTVGRTEHNDRVIAALDEIFG